MGVEQNIADELLDDTFREQMKSLGLNWQLVHDKAKWPDYSNMDAMLAVRSFGGNTHDNKPAAKLYNAWHAGVPAVLGQESAFRHEGSPGNDYVEVGSPAETVAVLKRLKEDLTFRQDLVAAANEVQYSLNTILTGKLKQDERLVTHEYIYFDISQAYDMREARRRLVSVTDERHPFEVIKADVRIRPTLGTKITGKGEYDVYETWFNEFDASFAASGKRGSTLDLSYRFERATDTKYLEGSTRLKLTEPVDLTYRKRYSLGELMTSGELEGMA